MRALHSLDDVQLVARCRDGDERAWRVLVARYQSLVYSVALRTGLDEDAASDAFQQVWLEVHRSLDRIRDAQALPKWLMITTRRVAYRVALRGKLSVDDVLEELVDPRSLPGDEFESWQDLQRIERAIESLGGTCTRLLRLLFLEQSEPSYLEISERAEIAVGSIGPLRARCLGRLRAVLEEDA